MKRRVARLLEEEVPPEKVLAVTFTRVAAEDLHRELQKLDVPGCEELRGPDPARPRHAHSWRGSTCSRASVRTPRPLNTFEQKAMYCDIASLTGGKRKMQRRLIEAYEAAWAQSQGDQPGFPKTEEEKAFQKELIDWHLFHESMLIGEVIPYLVRYLKENPAADQHTEFSHVLADKDQDLNKAEQTAIAYLSREGAHLHCRRRRPVHLLIQARAPRRHPRVENDPRRAARSSRWRECQRCPTTVVEDG